MLMEPKHFRKAALLSLTLLLLFVVSWEGFWRSKGFPVSYNDDEALWASQRKEVYQPKEKSTVFIGSSRIKFDLDIPTWEGLTGDKAVQLSMVGTSPRPLLHDLANDEKFKGKLVIDVTEGLFFSRHRAMREKSATEGIAYYKDWTPAQKMSAAINHVVESGFVFLEEDRFALNALLSDLEIPNRPGIFSFPRFPKEFGITTARRQDYMTERFLTDTVLQRKQTDSWTKLGGLDRTPGIRGDSLEAVFKEIKTSVDKIRSRGGEVIFVRTPASGPMEEATKAAYPRNIYWDGMLKYTNTQGIHYADYPATAHFICPEWSHLSSKDAISYTKQLARILQDEKRWRFPKKVSVL